MSNDDNDAMEGEREGEMEEEEESQSQSIHNNNNNDNKKNNDDDYHNDSNVNVDVSNNNNSNNGHNRSGSSSIKLHSPPRLKTQGLNLDLELELDLDIQDEENGQSKMMGHKSNHSHINSLSGYDTARQTPTPRKDRGGRKSGSGGDGDDDDDDDESGNDNAVEDSAGGGGGHQHQHQHQQHKYTTSFISSSTDSNSQSQSETPTVTTPMNYSESSPSNHHHHQQQQQPLGGSGGGGGGHHRLPTSPEESEVHHPHHIHDYPQQQQQTQPQQQPQPQRSRIDSEESYNIMRNAHNANLPNSQHHPLPKFYESDVDSVNDSLIYSSDHRRRQHHQRQHILRDSKDRFPSLSSIPSDEIDMGTSGSGSGSGTGLALPMPSQHQQQQHRGSSKATTSSSYQNLQSTPQKSGTSSSANSSTNHDNMTTSTPNISNLTKHRGGGRGGGGSSSNTSGNHGDHGNGGADVSAARVLPYQKRKQLNQQQHYGRHQENSSGYGSSAGAGAGTGSNSYDRDHHDPYSRGYGHGLGHGYDQRQQIRYGGYEGQQQQQQTTKKNIRPQRELSTISTPIPNRSPTNPNSYGYGHGHGYGYGNYNQLPPSGHGHGHGHLHHQQPPISTRYYGNNDNDYHGGGGGGGGGGRHPPRHPKNPKKGHNTYGGDGHGHGHSNHPPPHSHYNDGQSSNGNRPPAMHVRMESSGSVSSLGSAVGGASMAMKDGSRFAEKLGREIQEFHHQSAAAGGGGQQRRNTASNSNQNQKDNASDLRNSDGFLTSFLRSIDFTSEGSFTSHGSLRSVEDERADYRKKGLKILKKAERERKKQQKKQRGGGLLSNISDRGRSSIRSLSPASRSQHSHRPRLPSIDNDDWEEEADRRSKESKSQRGGARKKALSNNSRPPRNIRNLKVYGATDTTARDGRGRSRWNGRSTSGNDSYRDERSNNGKGRSYNYRSESEESSEDESCISSDFTSNRYDTEDGEDSSVYVDESEEEGSDEYLSYGDEDHSDYEETNEQTNLLPPGDNTHEYDGRERRNHGRPPRKKRMDSRRTPAGDTERSRYGERRLDSRYRDRGGKYDSREKRWSKRDRNRRDRPHYQDYDYNGGDYGDGRGYPYPYLDEKQRQAMREEIMRELKENQWQNRFGRWIQSKMNALASKVGAICSDAEAFISNLPLTIGAVALAVVTLGVVWFKFAEEMMDSCVSVHFHSSQCTFPEFPGCFYCDTTTRWYKIAYGFHNACTGFAFVIAMLFLLKIVIARKVVIDEMNSPTTSSPAGLICMTLVCVCAGRGPLGQAMVSLAAATHFVLAAWFIYMASAYNILPDPSWYPNTVGIGISAVKTWLYYPMPGHFLMLTSISLFLYFFPISLFRVFVNHKLSAPVSWIQMSAPAVSLYALTIMAQPSFEEEHPDITQYERVLRRVYLPTMHFFFAAAVIGALSSVQSLIARWETFSKKPFSPAHAAFCFPTLAHANAIQAYRGALNSFSDIPPGSPFKLAIDAYWFFVLITGTIATIIITAKFIYMLPSWTKVNVEDEVEPPQPHETLIADVILAGETYRQDFVSPAVLQANETGALVQVREAGRTKYVRTRRVTALGFEPIMDMMELLDEREKLLQWVEKNPPRQRKRTLSVPGITIPGNDFGRNNSGVYGAFGRNTPSSERRRRAATSDGNYPFLGNRYGGRYHQV